MSSLSDAELIKRKRKFEERARACLKKKLSENGIPETEHDAILLQRRRFMQKGDAPPPLPKSDAVESAQKAAREAKHHRGLLYKKALRRIECSRLSFLFGEHRAGRLKDPVAMPLCYRQYYRAVDAESRIDARTCASSVKSDEDLERLMSTMEYVAFVKKHAKRLPAPFWGDISRDMAAIA